MAWTATILSREIQGDRIAFQVRFTDGAETIDRQIDTETGNVDFVASRIDARLNFLNARTAVSDADPDGPYVPRVVAPARRNFSSDLRRLRQLETALSLQLILASDTELTTLRGDMAASVIATRSLLTLV